MAEHGGRAVNTLRALLLTMPFVIGAAAADSGDYELVVPPLANEPPICAKDAVVCGVAQAAIRTGRWPIAPRDTVTACVPHDHCFPPETLCIESYNCEAVR